MLASFVAFLDGSVVNLALPAISADLGGGLALQQWVVDGYLLALGALILVAGAVSDRYGRLAVLRAGLIVFAVSSVLCALAPTGWILVGARCLQGVGAAFLVPSSLAMINTRFTGRRQAAAIGTWTAWTGTAFLIGPPLGGVLVDASSWRWVFGINVVPVVLTLVLTTRLGDTTEDGGRRTGTIDVVGAALSAVGLSAAVFALIEAPRLGPSHPAVFVGLLVGVACLAAFPWWEHRAENPTMPLTLFRARNFWAGNVVTVFFYAGVSLGMLLVALFLQETVGLSATLAGLVTLPIPLASFLLSQPFGALSGRYGPRWFMTVGPLVAASAFVLLATATADGGLWTRVLPGLLLLGLGLSITVSPLTAAVLAAVPPQQSGIGSAVNNAASRIAGLIAIAFLGVIVSAGQVTGSGAMDLDGFRQGCVVVAVLFAIAGSGAAVGISNASHDIGRVTVPAAAACQDRAAPPSGLHSARRQ